MILKVQWVLVSPMGLLSSTDLPGGALHCTYLIESAYGVQVIHTDDLAHCTGFPTTVLK